MKNIWNFEFLFSTENSSALTEETGASIDLDDSGLIKIFGETKASADAAIAKIEEIVDRELAKAKRQKSMETPSPPSQMKGIIVCYCYYLKEEASSQSAAATDVLNMCGLQCTMF